MQTGGRSLIWGGEEDLGKGGGDPLDSCKIHCTQEREACGKETLPECATPCPGLWGSAVGKAAHFKGHKMGPMWSRWATTFWAEREIEPSRETTARGRRAAKSYKEGSPEGLGLVVNGWDLAEDQKYKYTRKREFTDFIYPPLDECYFFTIKKTMFYLKLQFFSG